MGTVRKASCRHTSGTYGAESCAESPFPFCLVERDLVRYIDLRMKCTHHTANHLDDVGDRSLCSFPCPTTIPLLSLVPSSLWQKPTPRFVVSQSHLHITDQGRGSGPLVGQGSLRCLQGSRRPSEVALRTDAHSNNRISSRVKVAKKMKQESSAAACIL